MIYLIKSSAFREVDGKDEFFFILKIGYTGDNEKTAKSRFESYKLHNPTYKLLYTLPELTSQDENKIQKKFRDYVFPGYGDEWFYYKEEIIEFFDKLSKLNTQEVIDLVKDIIIEVDKSIESITNPDERKFVYDNRPAIRLILSKVLSSRECFKMSGVNNILIDSYESGYKDFPSLLEYVKKRYGESVVKDYEDRMKILNDNPESKKIVEKYHKCTNSVEKMKVLCENKIDDIILSNISDSESLKTYYKLLGPEKIKATGYNISFIMKEFNKRTFHDVEMYKEVFEDNRFKPGSRIEKTTLKEYFRDLYNKYGYKASPKATNLRDYFNIKDVLIPITDENGSYKRVKGFEVLGYNIESEYYKEYQEYLNRDQSIP